MRKRKLLLIGLLLGAFCATGEVPEEYRRRALRVVVYDAARFGFQNPDGAYGGLMVELWEDIALELDLQYEYALADMEGVLTGLQENRYDLGLGAISITPQREKLVDFTQAVNPSGTGIAVASGAIENSFQAYWRPILGSLLRLVGLLLLVLFVSGTLV